MTDELIEMKVKIENLETAVQMSAMTVQTLQAEMSRLMAEIEELKKDRG